jgi:hypothetical protein
LCGSPAVGLEAFGFKEGARFAAAGVEGGLLILVLYEAAPNVRASQPDTSRALDAEDDSLRRAISRDVLAPPFALRSRAMLTRRTNTLAPVAPALTARS